MLANKLIDTSINGGGGGGGTYVDDVFSTYLYNGTGATQTITNGIDLAGEGGLVWIKGRTNTEQHALFDTARGINKYLSSASTVGQVVSYSDLLTSFNSTGFTLGADASTVGLVNNSSSIKFSSWTFRRAPKFFDVVTYTGSGSGPRAIPHALGTTPGMVIVKATSQSGDFWNVWHNSLGGGNKVLYLNAADAVATTNGPWGNSLPNASSFYVGSGGETNSAGVSYVAYLFAHDTSTDGIIQCGSFTTDGSGNATVNLGWEPQFVQAKASSTAGAWFMLDQMRGWGMSTDENLLSNSANAAITGADYGNPTATGFTATNHTGSATYIYLAIRRPNKPPTTGTQVYNAIARTGTGIAATVTGVGFAPDLVMTKARTGTTNNVAFDRMRGKDMRLNQNLTDAEYSIAGIGATFEIQQDGFYSNGNNDFNGGGVTYINHFFKRSVGCFDVVCYTGTGSATTIPHSLGVVPELMIVKRRDTAFSWYVYHKDMAATDALILNDTLAKLTGTDSWGNTRPTATVFSPSNTGSNSTNAAASTYVNYLFASKAGISKCGSYTGNGSTLTVDCGFTTGARFVLIKRIDATGDWKIFDSVRGIVAGNDSALLLNVAGSEDALYDAIDPDTTGFIVNSNLGGININAATYIYLAFA